MRRQVANLSAAKSSLEASLSHSTTLAAAVNSGALQLGQQLQRYAERAVALEAALKKAEAACEAQAADLAESVVRVGCMLAWAGCKSKSGPSAGELVVPSCLQVWQDV